MATVKIDLSLEDSKGSIRSRKNEVEGLNKELEKTKRLATGTRSGGQAVRASYSAALRDENTEYNRARGSMGSTGASGRDFAKQAQGLDGLVRLYAVYAANLFAVSAAFNALRNAMDTTNMIEGLNQLGAASGVAMGSLAKRFSEASGGAISLRESMEATAKAVSSGLSQAQFLKLGDVAKKASQALGVNMSDAVSRLTRGITKLEPELLDELGIFTKVGKATEDYAKNIGKPVAALTDFERRQAFANAVLEEGAKKFGEIDIPTNPYDKLLATLKNVAQTGLEIVNTVLAPFAKLLSSNTTVLVGILALIGTKLVSDALPALAQWRTGIKDAATQANKSSSDILESFGEKFVERTNAAFQIPDIKKNLKTAENEYAKSRAKFLEIDQAYTDRQKKNKFYSTMAGGGEISPASLQREITRLTKEGTAASLQAAEALKASKAEYIQILNLRARLTDAENKAQALADKPDIGESLRQRVSRGAAGRSERLNILSNVSDNFAEGGFSYAVGKVREEVAGSKTLTAFGKFRTVVTGTMIAATNAVGLFVSAFSGIFSAIGIISAAFSFIVPMFRENEEAADRFASSIDQVKDSNENAYRVMERLSKLDPLERLSIPSLQAKATALEGLGGSLVKALDDFEKEVETRNWADSTVNFIAGIFGKSSEEKLAAQLTSSVANAVKLAGSSDESAKIKAQLADLVSLPADSSLKSITDAINKAGPIIQKQATKLVENVGKDALRGTGSFTAFNESLVESGKIYQDLLNTFKNSSPLEKFAEDSTKKLIELSKVLESGTAGERLRELSDLSQNISFLQLLPTNAAKDILSVSSELTNLNSQYANSEVVIQTLNAELEKHNDLLAQEQKTSQKIGQDVYAGEAKRLTQIIRDLNLAIGEQKNIQTGISARLGTAAQTFSDAIGRGLSANIDTFTKGLQNAAAKASLELKKTYLEGISDPRIKAKLETDLQKKSLDLDASMLKSQLALVDSNAELRLAIMEATQESRLARVVKPGENVGEVLARPENRDLLDAQRAIGVFRANKGKTLQDLNAQIKAGGLDLGTRQGLGEAVGTARAKAEIQAQLNQIAGKKEAVGISGQFKEIDAASQVRAQRFDNEIAKIQSEKAQLELDRKSLSDEEYRLKESGLNIRLAEFEATKMSLGPERDLLKAKIAAKAFPEEAARVLKYAQDQADVTKVQADSVQNIAEQTAANNVNLASGLRLLEQDRKLATDKADKELMSLNTQIELNGAEQAILQTKQSIGAIGAQEFKTQSEILARVNLQLTSARDLLQARTAAADKLAEINKKELEAGGPGKIGPQTAADLDAQRAKVLSDLKLQEQGIIAVTEARRRDLDLIAEQTLRQNEYTNLFNGAMKSMEDAIVEFTKTGKLSFSSMIESFLEGLLRYEIQQQQFALFQGVGGARGLGTMLAGFMGFSTGPEQLGGELVPRAKGAAYDYGVQAFAKGGMFTNSIVDSPTLFKFAKGTGLMGEAGPEAIMPLTRDSSGNLGVRAQGGGANVDVVVNNYGTEKAETRETVDSRGNRRIEVTIGDMVAQEVTRTGSATQNAFSSTYGTRPALARR